MVYVNVIIGASSRQQREEIEDNIVTKYKVILNEKNYQKLLTIPDLELLAVEKDHSIRLYFLCTSQEALRALRKVVESGQVKNSLETLFKTFLLTDPVCITHLYLINYSSTEEYYFCNYEFLLIMFFIFIFFN